MTMYHYTIPWVVLDGTTGDLIQNRTDGMLLNHDGVQVPAYTLLGSATTIKTGPVGTTSQFMAEIPAGRVKFGTVEAPVWADEQQDAVAKAEAAAADAAAVRDQVTRIADTATAVSYFRRDPDGSIWVTELPVVDGSGGVARVSGQDVYINFPA